ncbi:MULTISPECIES: hypothetical protein [Flavobacteriaceae]|uniref:hypothetical protein n=1 Tax=Flavobacteriaceae TaxID=49546 RepID=UPI001492255E|nr:MULTISPECIES: hypothetical protein [Allomuricauda]MDC6364850.1 hypothetical protein [Muricauda sp. AC10]
MKSKTRILLTVIATVVGGLSLILYTTLSQDIILGGLSFCTSTNMELLFGTLATFASAVIAGFIASLIVVRDNHWPHFFISLFILGKMSLVVVCDQWTGPVLFESGLQFSLLGGLWVGHFSANKFPLAPV